MILLILLLAQINLGDLYYSGMPSNASSLAKGGCGVALLDDPAYYNPAMLNFLNTQKIEFSFSNYFTKNNNYYSKNFPGISSIDGKFTNSAIFSTKQIAVFWRLLEYIETDSIIDDSYINSNLRVDEAGFSLPVSDPSFSNLAFGFSLKYIHISSRELKYSIIDTISQDNIYYNNFSAQGFYSDIGCAYILNNIGFGISARNLFGKIWNENISFPTIYRAGISYNEKYYSLSYDFEYNENKYDKINHFNLSAKYYPLIINFGVSNIDDIDYYSSGFLLNTKKNIISIALWGTEEDFNNDKYSIYLSYSYSL